MSVGQGTVSRQIWVLVDVRAQRLFGLSLNVLTKACDLAGTIGGRAVAVVTGTKGGGGRAQADAVVSGIAVEEAVDQCVAHGAAEVLWLDHPALADSRADVVGTALAKAVEMRRPVLVLAALTDFGREVAARAARITRCGLMADCADLEFRQDRVTAMCPAWGGQIMAEISLADDQHTGFATVQPYICKAEKARGEPGRVERLALDGLEAGGDLTLLSRRAEGAERRKLEDAEIVVVGGAGVGNREGFATVRRLAAALGAQVGATRPVVLEHWVDESRLIGQTGKTVRPRLLFSIGTSGAVQYTAGIMEAETIVAINRDPNAPIFQVADLGIVADCGTVVPLLTEKVQQAEMRNLASALTTCRKGPNAPRFGEKIRAFRQAREWSQEDLAQRTGQSADFIAEVEADAVVPPVSFLLELARALKVDPGTFLEKREKAVIGDRRAQAFVTRTQSYSYETLTPGAENEHLRAFMITIEPRQAHKAVAYKHEGQEFIYVMEGDLEVTLGEKRHYLKPHESIGFHSDIPHKLKSRSDETTRCLVVLYTP